MQFSEKNETSVVFQYAHSFTTDTCVYKSFGFNLLVNNEGGHIIDKSGDVENCKDFNVLFKFKGN